MSKMFKTKYAGASEFVQMMGGCAWWICKITNMGQKVKNIYIYILFTVIFDVIVNLKVPCLQ